MKSKLFIQLFAFSLLIFVSQSCKKYENGPAISFISAEKRIVGKYELETYKINGIEIKLSEIGLDNFEKEYFEDGKGKNYSRQFNNLIETEFEWELNKDKTQIREREKGLNGEWGQWNSFYTITKLTKTEFWTLNKNSAEQHEFHYLKIK